MKASEFLAQRTKLLTALADLDAEIYQILGHPTSSNRAAARLRELFFYRHEIGDQLLRFGIDVEAHPAVEEASE